MEQAWIVCDRPSHGLPWTNPGIKLDSPRGEDPPGAVIGPFDDEGAARVFVKADPRLWIYVFRKVSSDITPEERRRAIAPADWSAQGQLILGAVWIKPKKHDAIGPFADEGVAMQFAQADPLLSQSWEFELRHNIKPDDLMDAESPDEFSDYRRDESQLPASLRNSSGYRLGRSVGGCLIPALLGVISACLAVRLP